jgi:hypothetical protein
VRTSFVRSIRMDTWSAEQVEMMRQGGNWQLREYFRRIKADHLPIVQLYDSKGAEYYREQLKLRVSKVLAGELPSLHRSLTPIGDNNNLDGFNNVDYLLFTFGVGAIGMTLSRDEKGQACVQRLVPDGTAEAVGVQVGDVIVTVAGKKLSDFDEVLKAMRQSPRPLLITMIRHLDNNTSLLSSSAAGMASSSAQSTPSSQRGSPRFSPRGAGGTSSIFSFSNISSSTACASVGSARSNMISLRAAAAVMQHPEQVFLESPSGTPKSSPNAHDVKIVTNDPLIEDGVYHHEHSLKLPASPTRFDLNPVTAGAPSGDMEDLFAGCHINSNYVSHSSHNSLSHTQRSDESLDSHAEISPTTQSAKESGNNSAAEKFRTMSKDSTSSAEAMDTLAELQVEGLSILPGSLATISADDSFCDTRHDSARSLDMESDMRSVEHQLTQQDVAFLHVRSVLHFNISEFFDQSALYFYR